LKPLLLPSEFPREKSKRERAREREQERERTDFANQLETQNPEP